MIEQYFREIKVWKLSPNATFDDLPIEYKKGLFKKRPIDSLTDNIVETLKVILVKILFDNWMYVSNPQMTISITYLLMVIKYWSQDDKYII